MKQKPEPGSKRDLLMTVVKDWLLVHPAGGTYPDVAINTGLSVQQVQRAAYDLKMFDDEHFSIPCRANGYKIVAKWNVSTMQGFLNQLKHYATRGESLEAMADKVTTKDASPEVVAMLSMLARIVATTSASVQDVIVAMEARLLNPTK